MTTRRRTRNDGDSFSRETKAKIVADNAAAGEYVHGGPQQLSLRRLEDTLEDMILLVGRGDGWMRWTSDVDGKHLFLKYKFTSVAWPNHYVFVSGPIERVADLIGSLRLKCDLVDLGQLKPTLDKPFNHM